MAFCGVGWCPGISLWFGFRLTEKLTSPTVQAQEVKSMRTVLFSTAVIAGVVWMGTEPSNAGSQSMSGIGNTNIQAATVENVGYRRRYYRRYGYPLPNAYYPPAYGYYVPPFTYVYPPAMDYALPPEGGYVDGPPPERDYGDGASSGRRLRRRRRLCRCSASGKLLMHLQFAPSPRRCLDLHASERPDRRSAGVRCRAAKQWGKLDIVLHSIAFAPKADLQGRVVDCSKDGFLLAMDVSCWSFIRMAKLAEPLMKHGGTLSTMTYYGSQMVVEHYNMMGPVKAALEAVTRYLAAELGPKGIRVHAISPGPLKTGSIGSSPISTS